MLVCVQTYELQVVTLLELTLALHWSSKGFMSDAVEGALGAMSGLCSISMEAFASLYPEPKQHAK